MVIKAAPKGDVFSDFRLDNDVHDNEEKLTREEEEEIFGKKSEFYDDSVFAQFHLDEIIKKNEERIGREKLQKKKEELRRQRDESIRGRLERAGGILFPTKNPNHTHQIKVTTPTKHLSHRHQNGRDLEEGGMQRKHKSHRFVRWEDSIRDTGRVFRGLKSEGPIGHVNGAKGIHHDRRSASSSRNNGSTVTTTLQDDDFDVDDDDDDDGSYIGNIDRNSAHTGNPDEAYNDDSDDDSFIGISAKKSSHTHNSVFVHSRARISISGMRDKSVTVTTTEVMGGSDASGPTEHDKLPMSEPKKKLNHSRDSVITRSRTGMPIGGMCVTDAEQSDGLPSTSSSYHWISPHSADTIFSDFDIDAIVEEYGKLHRKLKFGAKDDDDQRSPFDDDDDSLDAKDGTDPTNGRLGVKVRYENLWKLWIHHFPRTHGILFKVTIPLFLIVVICVCMGYALGRLEIQGEIASNDEVMRERFNLSTYPYERTLQFLSALPSGCFEYYLVQKNDTAMNTSSSNGVLDSAISLALNSTLEDLDNPLSNMTEWIDLNFPPITPGFNPEAPKETLAEIQAYLQVCEEAGKEIITSFVEFSAKRVQMASIDSMSFNWMRCWNTTVHGDVSPVFPSKEQLVAATQQHDFYAHSWEENRKELYRMYVDEANCTTSICEYDALQQSIADATGSEMCGVNRGASAWFWFVVLTTVGYGNQSPTTSEGRLLVGCLAWLFIILWAVILFVAGRVLGIIMDDMFRRFRCRFMTQDIPSASVWCLIAFLWVAVVGETYRFWYNFTDHPTEFQWVFFERDESDPQVVMTTGEAYWFSYISLLTVGLGDFYLDSESFFYRDLMIWTSLFLIGFTLLMTFLGQIADLTSHLLPDSGEVLKKQLRNTDLVRKRDEDFKKENEKGIEKLEKLVEVMDDDDIDLVTQRLTRIRVKKNLLVHLLHQTQIEMEYYGKRGERFDNLSYAKICQEENMLNEITSHTQKEREKLASYERTTVEPIKRSYFQDGTAVDDVGSKLHLRSGKKSVKTRIAPSTYL